GVRDLDGRDEGPSLERGSGRPRFYVGKLERIEQVGLHGFGQIHHGGPVAEPHGVVRVVNDRIVSGEFDFAAGIVQNKRHALVLRVAGLIKNGAAQQLHQHQFSVWRKRESLDQIGEGGRGGAVLFFLGLLALLAFFVHFLPRTVAFTGSEWLQHRKFFALEDTLGMAAGIAQIDVVALHVVFLVPVHAANRVHHAAVRGEGEGGHVLVDVDGGFVQVLRERRFEGASREARKARPKDRYQRRAQSWRPLRHGPRRQSREPRFAQGREKQIANTALAKTNQRVARAGFSN